MKPEANAINWFEIPAANIERAKKFYESIFGIEMPVQEMNGMHMAFFPYAPGSGKASGAVVQSHMHHPSDKGSMIYLNANPNMDNVVAKIEEAGGKMTMPKTKISEEIGHMAFFLDSEGNTVALHSQN